MIVIVVGLLALPALPFALLYFQDALFNESETRRYASLADASERIKLGWLPPFLPQSAKDIHEKINIDYNTVVMRFSFASSDFPAGFLLMDRVGGEQVAKVSPRWIVWRSGWIPKEIKQGRADKLISEGFVLYRVKETIRQQGWYLLIHREQGIAFGWNSNAG